MTAADLWNRVRGVWERVNPLGGRPRVDYEALISELSRAADESRRQIGQTTLVPCHYLVSLSPRDMDDWEEGGLADLLVQELERALAEYIQSRGYRVNGAVTVRLEANERLDDGYVGLTPSFSPYDPQQPEVSGETVLWPPHGSTIASLEIVSGLRQGETIAITRLPATIGRTTESNRPAVGFADDTRAISRRHAVIEQAEGRFFITDEGSLNGTHVNGSRLEPHIRTPLPPEARLSLGRDLAVMVFHLGDRSTVTGWQF